ncbi:hypothetical protein IG631_23115 [Alternaria alternata]|nr:hypothetical protein IG631_23115 [Alternaria alternata]
MHVDKLHASPRAQHAQILKGPYRQAFMEQSTNDCVPERHPAWTLGGVLHLLSLGTSRCSLTLLCRYTATRPTTAASRAGQPAG